MNWVRRLYRSSIGAKWAMALSGVLLFVFLIGHLAGNLQIFAGAEQLNHYAQSLRDLGPILWIVRIGLIVVALVHVFTALRLVRANEAARPVAYAFRADRQIKPQTRLMWTSGLVLLGYTLFHLAHLTWGFVYHQNFTAETKLTDGRLVHDVYAMTVRGFQVWWVTGAYVVAMVFLWFHLAHGIPSFFQTLGINHPKHDGAIRALGPAIATLFFVGYASIPIMIWLGRVTLPGSAP
jgi:succinate dehydrogenase / fumarate reductase cytochrome b subunit